MAPHHEYHLEDDAFGEAVPLDAYFGAEDTTRGDSEAETGDGWSLGDTQDEIGNNPL